MDEMHFLGVVPKIRILRIFKPHIFFYDQRDQLSSEIPCAEVCRQELRIVERKKEQHMREEGAEGTEETGSLGRARLRTKLKEK